MKKDTYTRNELRRVILRGNRSVYYAFYRMVENGINVMSSYELALLGGRMA